MSAALDRLLEEMRAHQAIPIEGASAAEWDRLNRAIKQQKGRDGLCANAACFASGTHVGGREFWHYGDRPAKWCAVHAPDEATAGAVQTTLQLEGIV